MGLFSALFGRSKDEEKERSAFPWIPLTSVDQLEGITKKSRIRPQMIFKHSTTCGISRMVIRNFQDSFDVSGKEMDIYYLDLHAYREVSNETAYRFQVMHQSPQLILIKDGTVVAHASHGSITDTDFSELI